MLDSSVRDDMLAAIPKLRAFAISLCHRPDRADDLVQETLLRACEKIEQFRPGTNMLAWLLVILRNQFYNDYRRRRREVEDANGIYAGTLVSQPIQIDSTEYGNVQTALAKLPEDVRRAFMLVCVSGLPYDEVARVCGCASGTVKSRVHRVRARLRSELTIEEGDIGDRLSHAVAVQAEQARICPRLI
jgi:RNA polymerase sigma-70 factor, ECF subfamily